LEPYDKIHGIQIPPRGVVHGDRMGRDVRFDEGPDRQLADSGGNFPAPVRYGIRLHPALRPRAHVGREPARRTAAGGRGAERRVALFPYRKHGSGVRPGLERFADRLHGARVDRRGDEPLLSRRADVAAADRRLGAGIRGDGARGAQRAFRAPPLAAGRHAGALGGDAMDGLFAGDQTPRRPLPRYLHHPESLFLRTRDDPPGLCVPAFRRGLGGAVAARRVGQPALSGRRGLDALLRALERRDAPSGSRQDNQLHLFQPAGDDRRGDALHRRAGTPPPSWPIIFIKNIRFFKYFR